MRFISESGGGRRDHATTPTTAGPHHVVDEFEPEEYRQVIEEVHDQVVFRDHADAIPMYSLWIFRDFGIEKYKGARNTKGLLTYAGLQEGRVVPLPVVPASGGADRPPREQDLLPAPRGRADDGIKAYSNAPALDPDPQRRPTRATRRNGELPASRTGASIANVFFWPRAAAPRAQRGPRERRRRPRGHRRRLLRRRADAAGARGDRPRARAAVEQPAEPAPGSSTRRCATSGRSTTSSTAPPTTRSTSSRMPCAARAGSRTRRLSKPEARTEPLLPPGRGGGAGDRLRDGLGVRRPWPRPWPAPVSATRALRGQWRDNALRLVPFRLYAAGRARPATRVSIPGATADYVVLVKAAFERGAAAAGYCGPHDPARGSEGRARLHIRSLRSLRATSRSSEEAPVRQTHAVPGPAVLHLSALHRGRLRRRVRDLRPHRLRREGRARSTSTRCARAAPTGAGRPPSSSRRCCRRARTPPSRTRASRTRPCARSAKSAGDDPRVRRYLALALGRLGDRARGARAAPGGEGLGRERTARGSRDAGLLGLGAGRDRRSAGGAGAGGAGAQRGRRACARRPCTPWARSRRAESRAALVAALADPVEDVRWNAAVALARRRDPAAAPVLLEMLDRAAPGRHRGDDGGAARGGAAAGRRGRGRRPRRAPARRARAPARPRPEPEGPRRPRAPPSRRPLASTALRARGNRRVAP